MIFVACRSTRKEVYELGVRWRDHADEEARTALIYSVLPLAVNIAGKWANKGLDQLELISLAYEGVLSSLKTFDPDKGALTTHATWHIKQKIRRGIVEDRLIHVPSYAMENKARQDVREKAIAVFEGFSSIDADANTGASIVSGSLTPVEEAIINEGDDQRILFYELVDEISVQQREVILRRCRGETLDVVGTAMKLTRERIRQIETDAVVALRRLADRRQRSGQRRKHNIVDRGIFGMENLDKVNLVDFIDSLTLEQVDEAIRRLEDEFETSRTLYTNKLRSFSVLKKAIEARDGLSKRRPDETSSTKTRRRRGGPTNTDRVIEHLKLNGPSANKDIIKGTSIDGSSVSATLVAHKETFYKNDEGLWDLIESKGKVNASK